MEQSFGIHVAKLVKFPQSVVKTADRVYNEFDDHHKLKTEDDSRINKKAEDLIDKLVAKSDLSVGDIQSILDEIHNDVINSEGHYKNVLLSKVV
uniref:Uncharacterized protein n=1 Tax=Megaselia scalaris TaxID=36166 RepID=T1GFX5_MEGSC